jgi:hypothetical protein
VIIGITDVLPGNTGMNAINQNRKNSGEKIPEKLK